MVSLEHLCGSVQTVLREKVVFVDEVEDERDNPVGGYGENQGQIEVGNP